MSDGGTCLRARTTPPGAYRPNSVATTGFPAESMYACMHGVNGQQSQTCHDTTSLAQLETHIPPKEHLTQPLELATWQSWRAFPANFMDDHACTWYHEYDMREHGGHE